MRETLKSALFCVLLLTPAGFARAELHGGIEIGAKGVKATVIDLRTTAGVHDVQVLFSATTNTTLSTMDSDGKFQPAALRATLAAVERFLKTMEQEHQLSRDHIYIVGSSGLFSGLKGKEDHIAANKKHLAEAIKQTLEMPTAYISAAREAELTFLGIVPRGQEGDAAVLDIGSGNTKGAYLGADKQFVSASIPFGSASLREKVGRDLAGQPFAAKLAKLGEDEIAPAWRRALEGKAGFADRRRLYLSGGAVWACATIVKPGDQGAYVKLSNADVMEYRKSLIRSLPKFPDVDLDLIADTKIRKQGSSELARVKETFSPEQLLAGAELLSALANVTSFDGREVNFARNGFLGWIVAYAAEQGLLQRLLKP